MDVTTAFYIVLFFVLLFIGYFTYAANPPLPGPPLRDYLPGGLVYRLLKDVRLLSQTLRILHNKYGDVCHVWLGPVRVVNVFSHADVAQVVSCADDFARAPALRVALGVVVPGSLFTTEGSIHREARQLLRTKFNHSMLESFHHKMSDAIAELCSSLGEVAGGGPVDLFSIIAVTTFRVITNVAFSSNMNREQRLEFNSDVNELVLEVMWDIYGYPIRQMLTVFGIRKNFFRISSKVRSSVRTFIHQRMTETRQLKDSRSPDMLDGVLSLSRGSTTRAVSLTVEAAIGGSLTTSHAVMWAMAELCRNPRVASALRRELDTALTGRPHDETLTLQDVRELSYLNRVWKETLRMHPLGFTSMRVAKRDTTLADSGVRVKKGTVLQAVMGTSHMDPRIWRNPKEFRPERSDEGTTNGTPRVPGGAFLPFGVGQLSCAGKFLADYEGPLLIAEMHRRFCFELDCDPSEIVSRSSFVESAKKIGKNDDTWVPVKVSFRKI